MEKQEFKNRICAMSEEEMKLAVAEIDTDILWDELRKRETTNRGLIKGIKELVN